MPVVTARLVKNRAARRSDKFMLKMNVNEQNSLFVTIKFSQDSVIPVVHVSVINRGMISAVAGNSGIIKIR